MALQSLLGSEALRRVVVHFAARPEVALHFRALERRLGLSRQSLKNALDTLQVLGLVVRMDEGRRAIYRAAEHPGWGTLREMIRIFASPAEVVGDLLRGVRGVQGAFIFGSAATGQMRPDSDVDVFVVGDAADAAELGMATMEAGMVLGREIDLKHYTPAEVRAEQSRPGTSYVKRVLAGSTEWAVGYRHMTGPGIDQLVANHWAEPLTADDAEVLGPWRRAIESFDDSTAPRLSRTGQFKQLYDAARQGVVAFKRRARIPREGNVGPPPAHLRRRRGARTRASEERDRRDAGAAGRAPRPRVRRTPDGI